MNFPLLVWGVGFGVLSSIPTGPVGVLILKNTLTRGPRAGLITLSSLLAAEVIYIALFLFGLAGFILNTAWLRDSLSLAGAIVLMTVGVKSLRPPIKKQPGGGGGDGDQRGKPGQADLRGPYMFRTGFLITLTNPAILMIFSGFLSSARTAFGADVVRSNLLAALVSMEVGVVLWFGVVILLLSRLPAGIAVRVQRLADRAAGIVLIGFGLWLIFDIIRQRLI